MKRIEKLTPQQIEQIPAIRDEWIRIGLSCEPADLERARAALAKVYAAGGLEPPKIVLVADSPIHGAHMAVFARAMLDQVGDQVWAQVWDQVRDQVGAQVRDQVRDQVWAQVRDQVWAQVRAQVRDQVGAQVWDQVGAQVWDQVRDQVGDQVWAQVRAQVRDQVGDQVWAQVRDQVFGSHDAGWLSFYDAFRRFGIADVVAPLDGLTELAKCCGWWAPYAGAAIIQHRHTAVHLDDRGRLHNESGPAVSYRDGFAVWSWHGVRVNLEIIEKPETITVASIRAEQNIEIRRVMIERMGAGRYLTESGASLIDMDERTCEGGGPRALLRDVDGEQWLVGTDGSTSRVYHMSVPREARTCREAHRAISGVDERLIVSEG